MFDGTCKHPERVTFMSDDQTPEQIAQRLRADRRRKLKAALFELVIAHNAQLSDRQSYAPRIDEFVDALLDTAHDEAHEEAEQKA